MIRLVCPDADLLVGSYDREDWAFYMHYLSVMTARADRPMGKYSQKELRLIGAKFLIEWVSLLTHSDHPERMSPQQCVDFIAAHDSTWDAVEAACLMSPRELNQRVGAYVDWFNEEKLCGLLNDAGFERAERSSYLQSKRVILRDRRYFDRTDFEMSLCVEATA